VPVGKHFYMKSFSETGRASSADFKKAARTLNPGGRQAQINGLYSRINDKFEGSLL
jgi:hypothetical protein